MERCVKISKRSVKNFRRLPAMYKRTFTFLFIQIDLFLASCKISEVVLAPFCSNTFDFRTNYSVVGSKPMSKGRRSSLRRMSGNSGHPFSGHHNKTDCNVFCDALRIFSWEAPIKKKKNEQSFHCDGCDIQISFYYLGLPILQRYGS